jgi:hypothetical protein
MGPGTRIHRAVQGRGPGPHRVRSPLVQQILQGKKNWKVAGLALTYRLHELDMLSDWHYRRACIELGKLGYRRSEPSGMPSRERSQLLDKVFTARKAKGITLHDIARDLHVSPEELSSWVFGLVVTARTGSSHASADLAARERPRLSLVR